MLAWMRAFSVFGLVLVGSFSQQFGARELSRWLLMASAVLLFLLLLSPAVAFGAMLSLVSTSVEASLMPITALTQDVLPERTGRINTLFRAVDIGAHITVPLVVTTLTSHADQASEANILLLVCTVVAMMQLGGAMAVRSLPSETAEEKQLSMVALIEAIGRTRSIYATALRIRDLVDFVLVINILPLIDSAARVFLAYRLVELGASDTFFGFGAALSSLFAFLAMIACGDWLDGQTLRGSLLTFMVLDTVAFIIMANTTSPITSIFMYALHCTLFKFCAAVDSMWVKRVANDNVHAAYAVRKVIGMGYKLIGGFGFGWVVQEAGVAGLYAMCATGYVPVMAVVLCLSEPDKVASGASKKKA